MKKTIIAICLSFFLMPVFATEMLTFKFSKPRIEYYAPDNYLTFEIYVKASADGTYLYGSQVICSVNIANVNTAIPLYIDEGFTFGTFDPPGPPAPQEKYNWVANYLSNNLNIFIVHNNNLDIYGLTASVYAPVTAAYQLLGTVYVPLLPGALTGTAGISFLISSMGSGNQTYATGIPGAPSAPYLNPATEGNSFSNLYFGRIFSGESGGWSEWGGSLAWTNAVNTSIWDGSATITQTNYVEAFANNVRVESGATLTIPSNKWLTVNGNMEIIGTATNLVVASGGSLIQNTLGIQATVKRYIGAWGDASHGWHLLSSPVAGQAISPAFTPSTGYDFYKWGETDNLWLNQKLPGNNITNFDPGIGYLVAYQSDSTKLFTGPLNVTDISGIALTRTPGAYSGDITPGWNLLGNPYSSAITWHTGWSLPPSITSNAKIWQDGTYASYVDVAPGGIIPATQGFMVETSDAETVAIPAAARTHNSIPWYKSTGNPYLKLVASNPAAQTAQECVVTFDSQSLPGYDPAYDSRFLPGYAPYFYSVDGIERLSTNVLQELSNQTTIPIDFVKTVGSDYVIEAVAMENFTRQVYLTDLKINHTQIMVVNQVYNFTSADGDDPARFLLTFGPMVGAGEKVVNNTGIYAYNNNLYIVNPGKATLEVFSLTGQKLHTLEIDNPGIFQTTLFLPTAYYVVRLTTGAKVVVSKVFLKS